MAATVRMENVLDAVPAATHVQPASHAPADTYVEFLALQKTYDGQTLVVRDLNLKIRRGEFLTLLGPSGSGKTTTLMMLAVSKRRPTAASISTAHRSRICRRTSAISAWCSRTMRCFRT